jgi:hypothetical protein
MRWACRMHGRLVIENTILVGKPEGKRELRTRSRWENNPEADFKGTMLDTVGWIHLF